MTTLLRYPRNVIALGGPDGIDLEAIDASVERIGQRDFIDLVRRAKPARDGAVIVRVWIKCRRELPEDVEVG